VRGVNRAQKTSRLELLGPFGVVGAPSRRGEPSHRLLASRRGGCETIEGTVGAGRHGTVRRAPTDAPSASVVPRGTSFCLRTRALRNSARPETPVFWKIDAT